ncbi:MAG: hypothetical protein WA880_02425 [Ornithinimicrobium sp.]
MSTQDRLEINWFNVVGASLGAVSSAVVLSTLGAAGTLLGAALGSVCITVGGAVYAHSMKLTKDRVAAAKSLAEARKAQPRERVMAGGPAGSLPSAESSPVDPARSEAEADDGAVPSRLRPALQGLPWKRIAVLAGALFAITMAVILTFELSTGRAVSTYTGGTSDTSVGSSFSGVVGSNNSSSDGDTDRSPQQEQGPATDGQSDEVPAQGDQQDEAPGEDEVEAPEGQQDEAPAQDEQQQQAPAEPAPAEPAPAPAPQPEAPSPQQAPQD